MLLSGMFREHNFLPLFIGTSASIWVTDRAFPTQTMMSMDFFTGFVGEPGHEIYKLHDTEESNVHYKMHQYLIARGFVAQVWFKNTLSIYLSVPSPLNGIYGKFKCRNFRNFLNHSPVTSSFHVS